MRIMKTSLRLEDVEKSYLGFVNSSARDALHKFAGVSSGGEKAMHVKEKLHPLRFDTLTDVEKQDLEGVLIEASDGKSATGSWGD
ncbi:MAG: hypothetical protein QXW47_07440 [Candidatus Jordarchaeales archaeon]